jgi:hypothetical protein
MVGQSHTCETYAYNVTGRGIPVYGHVQSIYMTVYLAISLPKCHIYTFRRAPSDCVGGVARQVQCCRAGYVTR